MVNQLLSEEWCNTFPYTAVHVAISSNVVIWLFRQGFVVLCMIYFDLLHVLCDTNSFRTVFLACNLFFFCMLGERRHCAGRYSGVLMVAEYLPDPKIRGFFFRHGFPTPFFDGWKFQMSYYHIACHMAWINGIFQCYFWSSQLYLTITSWWNKDNRNGRNFPIIVPYWVYLCVILSFTWKCWRSICHKKHFWSTWSWSTACMLCEYFFHRMSISIPHLAKYSNV